MNPIGFIVLRVDGDRGASTVLGMYETLDEAKIVADNHPGESVVVIPLVYVNW